MLKTTTQDERGVNCIRVNTHILFCERTFIEDIFIISSSNDMKFDRYGLKSFELAQYFREGWSDS